MYRRKQKKYESAEKYLTQVTEIRKELYGETSPEYHLSRIRLASYYLDYTNKIEEAEKIFEESYTKMVSKEIGPWQKDHLDILNHLATLYEFTDRYALASTTLDKASDVARSKFSDKDPEYGMELDRIAQLQIKLGQYERAEQNINKVFKDPGRISGKMTNALMIMCMRLKLKQNFLVLKVCLMKLKITLTVRED